MIGLVLSVIHVSAETINFAGFNNSRKNGLPVSPKEKAKLSTILSDFTFPPLPDCNW
jgi:hypothetical protein